MRSDDNSGMKIIKIRVDLSLNKTRNEGIDLTHNPEFTTLEFYMGMLPFTFFNSCDSYG